MAFPVLDASLAWIVTGTASAPGGTTKTCGPVSSVPPAGPILCLTVVAGTGLHCSRPVGFGGLVRLAVTPVGDGRSEAHLLERSPTPSKATTQATRVRRAIGKPPREGCEGSGSRGARYPGPFRYEFSRYQRVSAFLTQVKACCTEFT